MLHQMRLLRVSKKTQTGNNKFQKEIHFPYQEETPPTTHDQRLAPMT